MVRHGRGLVASAADLKSLLSPLHALKGMGAQVVRINADGSIFVAFAPPSPALPSPEKGKGKGKGDEVDEATGYSVEFYESGDA